MTFPIKLSCHVQIQNFFRGGGVHLHAWVGSASDQGCLTNHTIAKPKFLELREGSRSPLMDPRMAQCELPHVAYWLLGDFNLPEIDWENLIPSPECGHPTFYRDCLEVLDNCLLEQMVTSPTRGQNILDLFLTTNPTLVDNVSITPGLSDHDIVLIATTTVQSMWDRFATGLEQGIDKFIPVRKAGTRDGFPWINQEIRRLMRKRDKLYKRWSRSGRPYDKSKFIESQTELMKNI